MIWVLHGLVSQTDGAALYHGKGESLVGCEMEVGEDVGEKRSYRVCATHGWDKQWVRR